jgi:hypothetical protein
MAGGWRWGRCVRLQGSWCEGEHEGRSRMAPKPTVEPPIKVESGITYLLNGDATYLFHAFWGFLRMNVKLCGYSNKEAKISKVSCGSPLYGAIRAQLGNSVDGGRGPNCRRSSREPNTSKFAAKLLCDTYRCQHRYGRTYVGRDRAIPKFHAYVSGCPSPVEPLPLKLTVMPVVPEYDHGRSLAKVRARDVSV